MLEGGTLSVDPQGTIQQGKLDDLTMMRGIALQDPMSLRAMYDKYSPLVFTIAMRMLHRREDAEDIVADVFWELWEKSSRYDQTRASPSTYLVTLARSRCIDRTRRKSYRQQMTMGSIDEGAAGTDAPADGVAILDEQRQLVRSALSKLDDTQRQAVEAAYYEGLSHSEIADKLGKPLGTIKTHIRQGLIRLREALRKDGLTDGSISK